MLMLQTSKPAEKGASRGLSAASAARSGSVRSVDNIDREEMKAVQRCSAVLGPHRSVQMVTNLVDESVMSMNQGLGFKRLFNLELVDVQVLDECLVDMVNVMTTYGPSSTQELKSSEPVFTIALAEWLAAYLQKPHGLNLEAGAEAVVVADPGQRGPDQFPWMHRFEPIFDVSA